MTQLEDMHLDRPDLDAIGALFKTIVEALESDEVDLNQMVDTIYRWDKACRTFFTWRSLTQLRFTQDTRDEAAKVERDHADAISPKFTELNARVLKTLLTSPSRGELEQKFGAHAFHLWETEVASFDPIIEDDIIRESKLASDYTELRSSAEIAFNGENYNLSGLAKYYDVADRDTRHASSKARWDWVESNSEAFDTIFDELVKVRHEMAQKLGFKNFIELGYRRLQRTDYNAADVKAFRNQVREHIVPIAAALFEKQRGRLGVDKLMAWDEGVYDDAGNPTPNGDVAELTEAAKLMFDNIHPELGAFFRLMDRQGLMDLDTRKGKAGGGYCTTLADYNVPFIFANFNGTKHDAEVFTHEMGHAFQCYQSMDKDLYDYVWPTLEACEIHSMSLEFFTWPQMELFFGDDADRFRTIHLAQSLQFFAYGTAIDHFQHEVYTHPEASPQRRREMWSEMEAMYLPWRNWGDIAWGAKGGRWQLQSHLFRTPFYYIDYVLAQTCALQFWDQMQDNYEDALSRYVALCKRGGEAPFLDLAKSAGLQSPFEPGSLEAASKRAKTFLGL